MTVTAGLRDEVSDNGRHKPMGDDDRWTEGWAMVWYDPASRAGGFHHVHLRPQRDMADLWNFIVLEGIVVGKEHLMTVVLPEGDFTDLHVNSLHIQNLVPTRSHRVSTDFGSARSEVEYVSFRDPTYYSMDPEGSTIGSDHYESLGRVTGTLVHEGRSITVDGFGFNDHSWGPRDLSSILTHRWVLANFGPDLCICVWTMWTPIGTQIVHGYIWLNDEFLPVRRAALNFQVADDGHSPLAGDIRLWTADGRGWHLTATADTGSLYYNDHFMVTPAFATFELGGRLGSGLIELNELKRPAPWHREELGLDPAAWPLTRKTDNGTRDRSR